MKTSPFILSHCAEAGWRERREKQERQGKYRRAVSGHRHRVHLKQANKKNFIEGLSRFRRRPMEVCPNGTMLVIYAGFYFPFFFKQNDFFRGFWSSNVGFVVLVGYLS